MAAQQTIDYAEVSKGWLRFLQEVELARHYKLVNFSSGGAIAPNPLLESLLPTLLYVKMASHLDDALTCLIEASKLEQPERYRRNLGGRVKFLTAIEKLRFSDEILCVCEKRNSLAHASDKDCNWESLDADLDVVHEELKHLGFAQTRPRYEFYAENSRAPDSNDPRIAMVFHHCFGLKLDGEKIVEVAWDNNIHRRGGST